MKTKKRIFISFHMDDNYARHLLASQAKSDNFDLEFTDYSVKEPFDEKWKTQCRARLSSVDTVICLIGENTWNRDAVLWELRTAYELKKKVIGVRIHRDRWHSVPSPITTNLSTVINWDIDEIARKI
jgi:hypothetical protein